MSRPIPPLRPDLTPAAERVSSQPGRVLLRAPDGRLKVWLETEWRILMLADGTRTPAQLSRLATAQGLPASTEAVIALVQRARQAGLLRDRRRPPKLEPSLLSWRPLRPEEAAEQVQALPEARYRCEMCGESCAAGYEVGPLPLPVAGADAVPFPGATGQPQLHLHRVDGRCSQLDPRTGACRIHATLGFDRKPRACREFPLVLSLTPGGLRLSLQWECTRLHRSLTLAPPLLDSLSGPPVGIDAAIAPDALPLGNGQLIPFERYARLEAALLEAAASGDPDLLALSLPRLVARLGDRTLEPDALLRTLAPGPVHPLAETLVLEASELIEAVYRQSRAMAPFSLLLAPEDRRKVYRRWLEAVLEPWRAGQAVELPPMETPFLWRAWLRSRIFGLGLLKAPHLFAGAVDLALRYLVARTGCQVPLEVPWEGSPGDGENRRLVAVEHSLREERMTPAFAAAAESLELWLDTWMTC